jgi:hypothetical protein
MRPGSQILREVLILDADGAGHLPRARSVRSPSAGTRLKGKPGVALPRGDRTVTSLLRSEGRTRHRNEKTSPSRHQTSNSTSKPTPSSIPYITPRNAPRKRSARPLPHYSRDFAVTSTSRRTPYLNVRARRDLNPALLISPSSLKVQSGSVTVRTDTRADSN